MSHDALVVGAGPAGSAVATLLARMGWSVALFEKQAFPRRKVCGECIAAGNFGLLSAIGLELSRLEEAGPALSEVALARGKEVVVADLPAADGGVRWGRAIGREALDLLLLDNARRAGAAVFQPCSVASVGPPGPDGLHTLRTRDGRDFRAPVLIQAGGSSDTAPPGTAGRQARAGGQLRAARRAVDLLAFKATFTGASLPAGRLFVLALDGGYGGLVMQGGGIATLACCVRRDRLEQLRRARPDARAGDAVEAWLRAGCAAAGNALADATRQSAWLAAGAIRPGIRLSGDDGGFRVGNAGAEAHPILGEGISMALQSAALLCDHLRLHRPLAYRQPMVRAAAQAAYQASWHGAFDHRMRIAAAFAHAAMRPGASATLVALARRWPGLLTAGARWGAKARPAVGDFTTTLRSEAA